MKKRHHFFLVVLLGMLVSVYSGIAVLTPQRWFYLAVTLGLLLVDIAHSAAKKS